MPYSRFEHAQIHTVSSVVPATVRRLADEELFKDNPGQVARIRESVGLSSRVVAAPPITTVDLCRDAALRLIDRSNIQLDGVDALIFVTQTGDYILPCSAAILHRELRLQKNCAAFDVNLGCSGYVYGLWLASMLVESGGCKNVLLLCGDTTSRLVYPKDQGTLPLFGDAGTATLVVRADLPRFSYFNLFTDGSGAEHLIVPVGGFRSPKTTATSIEKTSKSGSWMTDESLQMNGGEVFNFTLREVPSSIEELLDFSGIEKQALSAAIFHQANRYIIQNLVRRLKIPMDIAPTTVIEKYGNQSSASIPVSLSDAGCKIGKPNVLLSGFGVGLSWGNAIVDLTDTILLKPQVFGN